MHLIKLCVGVEHLHEMPIYQAELLAKCGKIFHQTRNFPKKSAELVKNGSLYWVIRGQVLARQKILGFDSHFIGDTRYCQIILHHNLIPVMPTIWRAFQGWRYLDVDLAPKDIITQQDEIDETLRQMGIS